MAYGDATLDEIMRQLGASEGAPQPARPQFRITQASGVLPNVDTVPARAPFYNRPITVPAGIKAAGRRALGLGARFLGPVGVAAGILPAAEALKAGAEAAANAYVGPPGVYGTVARGAGGFGAVTPTMSSVPGTVATPSEAPVVLPEPLAGPENMIVPPRGTGFIRNNTTGRTTFLDSRGQTPEIAAAPVSSGNFAGDFTGALLGLKQVSGDNARKAAQAKAEAAALAARGTAARGAAALATSDLSARLAAEYLKANPGDIAGAASVLHGRSQGGGAPFRESTTSFPDPKTGAVTVLDARTGTAKKVIPQVPVQNITLAQAIVSAKKNGTYKSDAQVRADLAKIPGYKLVD